MGSQPPVIVVTGLAFEARIAEGQGLAVVCGAGRRERIAEALETAITAGARGIVSFGTAGGLAPDLAAGDWVVAEAIVSDGQGYVVDPVWSARMLALLPGAVHAPIAGAGMAVADASEKRALFQRTGAVAVDMESHIAAQLALKHGLPFTACRVVIDPADRELPHAALVAMAADGSVNIAAVLKSLARRPGQLSALMGLAADARKARAALLRGRRMLGPGFGFPGLGVPDFLQL